MKQTDSRLSAGRLTNSEADTQRETATATHLGQKKKSGNCDHLLCSCILRGQA